MDGRGFFPKKRSDNNHKFVTLFVLVNGQNKCDVYIS